jgi:hypothetical protein
VHELHDINGPYEMGSPGARPPELAG